MKWRQRIDYHGRRSYEPEEPAVGQFGFLILWLRDIAGHGLSALLRTGARAPSSTVLLADDERRFTLLGTSTADADPFPVEYDVPRRDARDCRVLP